jgi:hypothetical protein
MLRQAATGKLHAHENARVMLQTTTAGSEV